MEPRQLRAGEIDALGQVWHDAWREAHAHLLPEKLIRLRTLESFRARLRANREAVRVAGPVGSPLGFCWVRGDELFQLFVHREARGTGVAQALMADGEARLAEAGVVTAWLACAIGNHRAARFYEKCGWAMVGVYPNVAETPEGPMTLEVWRYEKRLRR